MEAFLSQHFVVEADHAAVGVAMRVPGGFRFVYSDPRYRTLDGRVFPRARALFREIRAITARLLRRTDRTGFPPS